MLKLYRDSISAENLIDSNQFAGISREQLLFDKNFKLGSTPCMCLKVKVVKSLLGTFEKILVTDDWLSTTDKLIATLELDSVDISNNAFDEFTLVDYMVRFNKSYNAYPLMPEATGGGEAPTLLDIWNNICETFGVETDVTEFIGSDKKITWYDSTITARTYISYIAELNGGFAYITPEGKLSLKQFTNIPAGTIPVEMCDSFKLGEPFTISRVLYDDNDGTFWEFGEETGSTLYVNLENVYITSEEDIENIYNIINGFSFYSITVGKCPILNTNVGELISFTLNGETYNTITQISQTYNGGWLGGYSCEVENQTQQETTVRDMTETRIKTIKTIIDRDRNEFTRQISEVQTNMDVVKTDLQNQINENTTQIIQNSQDIILRALQETVEREFGSTNERVESLETLVSVSVDGLRLQQNNDGSYVLITANGMRIYVDNQLQAYATSEGFNASTFLTGDWHIQPANNGNSLNFFKKGS